MISDPLSIENGTTDIVAPRIVSPNPNTGRFRGEHAEGSVFSFDFIQNGNTTRSRHLARFVYTSAPDANGVTHSCTFTVTMDEPADGSISNATMLALWNTQVKGTLNDTIVAKMLNGEV